MNAAEIAQVQCPVCGSRMRYTAKEQELPPEEQKPGQTRQKGQWVCGACGRKMSVEK